MKSLFKTLTIISLLGLSFLSLADANLTKVSLADAKLCEIKLILDPETKLEKHEVIPGTCR